MIFENRAIIVLQPDRFVHVDMSKDAANTIKSETGTRNYTKKLARLDSHQYSVHCLTINSLAPFAMSNTHTIATTNVGRNPKDSIKSTWQGGDKKEWTIFHWFFELLAIHPVDLSKPVPVFEKTDKIPNSNLWPVHRWILAYASVPMLIHYLYSSYTGENLTMGCALFLYGAWLNVTAIREIQVIRKLGHIYGYLDGDKHARDGVPDIRVREVVTSLIMTSTTRPAMAIFMAWEPTKTPESLFGWNLVWLFIELTMYPIMVDFWFYWYHRAMHDIPWLWQFHRTHHLTKHPNTLLSLYADGWQELFDIAVIPVLAT
ncbi:hypothetical protein NQ176_g5842 [Zarea fungicola]|uniref:Uncharacterized protein n=1 Tax=Zarea fungicola TaxID=93591 RepID=A0ACC1N6D1_9HYPO|nr:hypothetical protein NQ176_g5842 [Lecanicillium fungicola]